MTAWDEMLVAKVHPGQFNVPYVAGMNVTNLPTNTFSVSSSIDEACYINDEPGTTVPLGTHPYTILFWCPSMTAFSGPGGLNNIPTSDKLGGLTIFQVAEADMDTSMIDKGLFENANWSYTMEEVYSSDMTGFS